MTWCRASILEIAGFGDRPESRIGAAVHAGNAAYVNFTSGSSGRPKGIVIPHRGVVRLVRNTNYVQVQPGDPVAHASNVSFDAATFEI